MRISRAKTRKIFAMPAALYLAWPATVFAHEDKPDQPVGHQQQVLHLAGEHPITLGAGLTIVGQGMRGGDEDDGALTYSVDIAFESDFGDKGGAFIYLNTSQGASVATGAASGSNADDESGTFTNGGYSETRIAEAWYRWPFAHSFELKAGKIDPTGIYDGNEIANDETTQFLGNAFVNNPAIAFPGYTAGINLAYTMSENLGFKLGVFESKGDFGGDLDSTFVIGETVAGGHFSGHEGHVRLTLWNDDATENQGFALGADQAITDTVSLFARYGKQDGDQDFDQSFSLGGQMALGGDMIGLGYAMLAATGNAGDDDESHIEAYYKHALNDSVHVTLDAQSVQNPGFDSANDDVFVYGMRAQIDF